MATDATPAKSRRHWQVLRNALLQSTANGCSRASDATASSIASEFFPVFPCQTVPNPLGTAAQQDHAWVAYDLSSVETQQANSGTQKKLLIHEKRKDVKRVSIAELFSHQVNQGVDNTGNIRTWPSEQLLLSYVLKNGVLASAQRRGTRGELLPVDCCELGGGMAGLAGLGLLVCAPVQLKRVLLTDGNPLCVKNLQLCVDENRTQGVLASGCDVAAELLRWDRNAMLRPELLHQFDFVLASDCLFFEEFHEDLVHSIKSLLRPDSGRCLLLQPSRNKSMERFCAVAERHGFSIHRSDDYDPTVVQKHTEYQQTRPDYVPDVHFPVLLTLIINKSH